MFFRLATQIKFAIAIACVAIGLGGAREVLGQELLTPPAVPPTNTAPFGNAPNNPSKAQPAPTSSVPSNAVPAAASQSLNKLVTALVLKHMPHNYTRDKDWGTQDERWDGLKVERDGLKIKTKRRKKKVNHGTWRKYSAKMVDPKKQFDVSVTHIRQTPEKKLAFRINFATRIRLDARQSKWAKGVQLYSISAEGHASIRLSVDMQLGMTLVPGDFPPDIKFEPKATAADLIVDDFRIDRVSKLGGEFAQQITRLARKQLDSEIEEKEVELVEKINKEIAEEKDKLQLSLSDALKSKWAEQARPFLPEEIQQAAGK